MRGIKEHRHIEDTLRFIAEGEWLGRGEEFLPALARYLGKTLGVDYVVIDKLAADPAWAETVAVYARGEIVPNMRYALQHTPCANVMTGSLCSYASGVQRQFPLDALLVDMQVESYAGIPLRNAKGEVLGLVAVMDGKPMADVELVSSLLQLVVPSAAAELRRSEAEDELRASREALKEAQRIAQVGSWELDLVSGKLDWSDEIYRIFEIDPRQFGASYEAFLNAIHPDDREMVNEAYTSSLENRTAYCIDHRLRFANGRIKHVRECCETHYREDGKPLLSIGTVQDISERKQLDIELHQQAAFQQGLLDAMNEVGMQLMVVEEGRITYVSNRKLAGEFGYTGGELESGTPLLDIIHPDDRARVMDYYIRRMRGEEGVPNSYELGLVTKSGERREYETSVFAVPGTHPLRIITIGKDISERKRLERELQRREAEFRTLAENAPDSIFRYDREGRRIYVNAAGLRRSGKTREELFGTTPQGAQLLAPDEAGRLARSIARVLETGETSEDEVKFIAPDGREFLFFNRYVPEFGAGGQVESVLSMSMDITERKRMEEELRLKEIVVDQARDGIYLIDEWARFVYVNDEACRALGYSREELLGMGVADIDHAESAEIAFEVRRKTLEGGAFVFETRHRRRDGSLFPVEVLAATAHYKGKFMGMAFARDITERKRMETELAERERDFRSLAANMPDNIARFDAEGRYLYINPVHERTLGKSFEEVAGTFIPDTHDQVKAGIAQVAASGQPIQASRQRVTVNDVEELHDVSLVPEFDANGKVVSVLGIGRDMTDVYRMQEAIAQREQEFRSLAESSPDYIIRYDLEHRVRYLNTQLAKLMGLSSADELIGRRSIEMWPDGRYAVVTETARRAIAGGKMETTALTWMQDGKTHYGHIYAVPERDVNGNIIGAIAVGRDVTDICEAERHLQHFMDNLPGLAYTFHLSADGQAGFSFVSHGIGEIYGLKPEEAMGDMAAIHNLAHPEDRPRIEAAIAESARTMEPFRMETRICPAGMPEKWLDVRSVPEPQPDGSILWYGIMLDITERKRLENELRAQTEFQRTLLDAINEVGLNMMLVEQGRVVHFSNKKLTRGFGLGEAEIEAGVSLLDYIHPDDRARVADIHRRRMAGETAPSSYELAMLTPGGERRDYEVYAAAVPGTQPLRTVVIHKNISERKRQEDVLRKREEEFRVLVESSPDPIVRYDRELRRTYINPAWEAVNGIPIGDALGKRPSELAGVVSGSLREYEAKLRQVLESRRAEEIEIGGNDGTGEMKYFAMRVVPEFGEDGQVSSLLTVARDITGRKKMEDAMHHSREILADAQRIALLGSWDWDVVLDRVEWSDMAFEIYTPDKRPADPGFEDFKKSVHPDDLEGVVAAVQAAFVHDASFDLDHRVVSASKGVRVVHAQGKVFRDANGKPVRMVGTVQDITERKQMEENIAESRDFLRTIMNGIIDPIFVKDRRHVWIEFNQAFCDMVGHTREEMLGKSDYDFLPQEQSDVFWAKDEAVFESGEINLNEEAITGADGVEHYIQTKKMPIFRKGSEPLLVGVIRDITERREMEMARETVLAEAVRLGQLRSAFLAQMSHELRTPLNGILGYAQNLLLDGGLTQKQRTWLNIIQGSGDHLLGLLNDVLDNAKIEADKLELDFGEVRMAVLLRTVAELMQARAAQKKLEFVCTLDKDMPAVIRGDEQRLRQVLLNLLSNAIKFTAQGQVSLRVSRAGGSRLRFEVRDTGTGIAAGKLERIFLPFEQAGEGGYAGGTGLGLAISRKLVRLMGGDIKVESQSGMGSVFFFELKLEEAQHGELDMAIAQHVVPLRQLEEIPLCIPGQAELAGFYELAKRGNMRNIALRASALAELDESYVGFTMQMMELANNYQSKAILQFIEQCMAGKGI